MRRLFYIAILALTLGSCNRKAVQPMDLKIHLEHTGGSRARFSVSTNNRDAYYTYALVSQYSENYFNTDIDVARQSIRDHEETYSMAEVYGLHGSFSDLYLFRGSRQFTLEVLSPETDYRFIVFQVHPKTHAIIGEPLSSTFRTRAIPIRDLTFDVSFVGDNLHIVPSDSELTYIWDYEDAELVKTAYSRPIFYLYSLVEMYEEYGFLDSMLSKGPQSRNLTDSDEFLEEGEECVLVICGCERAEFTTQPVQILFRYQKGNVEVLDWAYYGG